MTSEGSFLHPALHTAPSLRFHGQTGQQSFTQQQQAHEPSALIHEKVGLWASWENICVSQRQTQWDIPLPWLVLTPRATIPAVRLFHIKLLTGGCDHHGWTATRSFPPLLQSKEMAWELPLKSHPTAGLLFALLWKWDYFRASLFQVLKRGRFSRFFQSHALFIHQPMPRWQSIPCSKTFSPKFCRKDILPGGVVVGFFSNIALRQKFGNAKQSLHKAAWLGFATQNLTA